MTGECHPGGLAGIRQAGLRQHDQCYRDGAEAEPGQAAGVAPLDAQRQRQQQGRHRHQGDDDRHDADRQVLIGGVGQAVGQRRAEQAADQEEDQMPPVERQAPAAQQQYRGQHHGADHGVPESHSDGMIAGRDREFRERPGDAPADADDDEHQPEQGGTVLRGGGGGWLGHGSGRSPVSR